MYTLSITKFKGGVGGTETAFNLAQLYAFAGWRVLVVDTDPQSGVTKRLLPPTKLNLPTLADAVCAYINDRKNPTVRLSQVVRVATLKPDARKKESFQIAVAPANRSLQDEESNISKMPVGRTKLLKRMLATVADHYDICIIDTPPVFGYLSRNAIVAADGLLLPLLPEPPSFDALVELRAELEMMSEEDEVPPMVGTIISRFSVKSDRHQVGEILLEIAGELNIADALSRSDDEVVNEFDMSAIDGLRVPYLGNVPNDNDAGNVRSLRKAYTPVAQKLAKLIGLGVLNLTTTEVQHASVSA